ncbi:chaplin [Streptomyces sp. NPDC007100]|uniref:chaplin n=1 Tax=Streptomyces sp. NPDC007100 TaxID=3155602 RepID=UPI0033D694B2
MREVAKKGLITIVAAGGVLAVAGGYAHADSGAQGKTANSPGVLSGNTAQIPVNVPVQACGNSVDVVGLLNPSMGNHCDNGGGSRGGGSRSHGSGGAGAQGTAQNSPGVASGNQVQAPVHAPVNACGNSVSVVGVGNAVNTNGCGTSGSGSGAGDGTGTGTGRDPEPPSGRNGPQPSGGQEDPRSPAGPGAPAQDRAGGPAAPGAPGGRPAGHRPDTETAGAVQERGARTQEESEPRTQIVTPPEGGGLEHLAQTGAAALGVALPASAGLLIGGAVLYRRARSARV